MLFFPGEGFRVIAQDRRGQAALLNPSAADQAGSADFEEDPIHVRLSLEPFTWASANSPGERRSRRQRSSRPGLRR